MNSYIIRLASTLLLKSFDQCQYRQIQFIHRHHQIVVHLFLSLSKSHYQHHLIHQSMWNVNQPNLFFSFIVNVALLSSFSLSYVNQYFQNWKTVISFLFLFVLSMLLFFINVAYLPPTDVALLLATFIINVAYKKLEWLQLQRISDHLLFLPSFVVLQTIGVIFVITLKINGKNDATI